MKKKIAAIALALAALAIGLTGCGEAKSRTWSENGKLKVIATVFPYYDFVRQIAGDAVDVEQVIEQRGVLVGAALGDSGELGPQPQRLPVENAKSDVGVSNINCQQHQTAPFSR